MSNVGVLLGLIAVLPLPSVAMEGAATAASAAVPVVTLVSDSANLSTRQLVDTTHSADGDASSRQFLTLARHVAPAAKRPEAFAPSTWPPDASASEGSFGPGWVKPAG